MLEALSAEFDAAFVVVPWQIAALRLVVAGILGGMIGWERHVHEKAAGLRTHMMVSLAACLFTLIAFELTNFGAVDSNSLRIDPLRLISAVTSGVAFLAAGTIIVSEHKIRGLTTGAGLWAAGAIGLACGAGQMPLAVMASVLALFVLAMLRRLER